MNKVIHILITASLLLLFNSAKGRKRLIKNSILISMFVGKTIDVARIKRNVHAQNSSSLSPHLKHRSGIMFSRSVQIEADVASRIECTDSSEDFPQLFTDEQRKNGAVALSFFVGIYCFTLLAILCDNYFLPCVERFCKVFDLSDVSNLIFLNIQ